MRGRTLSARCRLSSHACGGERLAMTENSPGTAWPLMAADRRNFAKEFVDSAIAHLSCARQFACARGIDNFPLLRQHGYRGDAMLERYAVRLGNVDVAVKPADIDLDDPIVFGDER